MIGALIRKRCCGFFRKFSVLDIGTGDGSFLYGLPSRVKTYGITATNMRNIAPDDCYRICNAETLLDEFAPQSIDFIVSHLAFVHMFDPLKALQEAYIALKPKGFLLIDKFQLKGVDTEAWIDQMQGKGYEMASLPAYERDGEKSAFEFLMIRKTKPILETEIAYEAFSNREWNGRKYCQYRWTGAQQNPLIFKNPQLIAYLKHVPTLRVQQYERNQQEGVSALEEKDLALLKTEDAASVRHLARVIHQLDKWEIPHETHEL